jgi:hypothetical protein
MERRVTRILFMTDGRKAMSVSSSEFLFGVAMFGGFVHGFEFHVTLFSVWCICEVFTLVLEFSVVVCWDLGGVFVCAERRS